MIKDIFWGAIVVLIVVLMWSWASSLGPRLLLSQDGLAPIVPCTTDSDCMAKNPHLGDY